MNTRMLPALLIMALLGLMPFAVSGQVSANATRPSASDNGYLTARGYAELELGGAVMENFWSIPALLKFSPAERVELAFAMSGILNHFSFPGFSDTEVGDPGVQVKGQLSKGSWGALAVVGRADFVSERDPRFTGYGVVSLQASSFQLDITAGGATFDVGGGDHSQSFIYAAALSPKLSGDVGAFVELFGEEASGSSTVAGDFGFSFAHSPRLIYDVALTIGLSKFAPDWALQFGFTATLFPLLR